MNKNKKRMKYISRVILSILLICVLTGCKKSTLTNSENDRLDDGVSAVEDAMKNKKSNDETIEDSKETRKGTSKNTIGTPKDFPSAYNYGTGKISDYKRSDMLRKMPKPKNNETVLKTKPDITKIQALYLWEKDNVPAVTEFIKDMTGYFDSWDFRPYVTSIAVRFIRENAKLYQIDPDNIAVMGFSAGGIQAGEFLMHYDEKVDGRSLDQNYVPDELDKIPAHASADGMIYSFYDQFEEQYEVLKEMKIPTRRIVLDGWPHGFGSDGGWVKEYANWLESVFSKKQN